jgi:hypothetical protein
MQALQLQEPAPEAEALRARCAHSSTKPWSTCLPTGAPVPGWVSTLRSAMSSAGAAGSAWRCPPRRRRTGALARFVVAEELLARGARCRRIGSPNAKARP